MSEETEIVVLKKELIGLFEYIKRVREEIAHIQRPADEDHGFESMGEQLDGIVKATEKASNTIMETMEVNNEALDKLRNGLKNPKALALIDQMEANANTVFEACAFQDLTGQRVNKVIKSVTYVEDRVTALIEIWGKEEVGKVEVKGIAKTEDEKLLHGPQDEDKALAQAEIDALFD